ncbi:hypothetical protein ACQFCN_001373 [Enterobacter cloacae]
MTPDNSFVDQFNELRKENGYAPVSVEDLMKALESFNAGGEWLKKESDRAGHRAPSHAQKKSPIQGC